jgi:hypothetical protein
MIQKRKKKENAYDESQGHMHSDKTTACRVLYNIPLGTSVQSVNNLK